MGMVREYYFLGDKELVRPNVLNSLAYIASQQVGPRYTEAPNTISGLLRALFEGQLNLTEGGRLNQPERLEVALFAVQRALDPRLAEALAPSALQFADTVLRDTRLNDFLPTEGPAETRFHCEREHANKVAELAIGLSQLAVQYNGSDASRFCVHAHHLAHLAEERVTQVFRNPNQVDYSYLEGTLLGKIRSASAAIPSNAIARVFRRHGGKLLALAFGTAVVAGAAIALAVNGTNSLPSQSRGSEANVSDVQPQ